MVPEFQGRNQLFISGRKFSWNFIRWCHCAYSTWYNFSQTDTDKVLFAAFPKM